MKSFILLFLVCSTSAYSQAVTEPHNPILPGWYADPEGILLDDTYWIYPTFSAPYNEQVFMDAFSSKDLRSWTKHSRIIDTAAIKWARRAMWAPAIVHENGKYYLFYSANDVHEGEVGGIGVAVADRPEGPFTDLIGKPLIGQIHNGAQPIDQFVFKDKDGQYYMFYGGWRHCNLVRLKNDFMGLIPFDDGTVYKEVTPEGYVEGPFMFVRDGRYYFMWSEGGWGGPHYKVAYSISDSLGGPFKRIGTVLEQDPAIATGAGHHSILADPKTKKHYIIYHRRPLGKTDPNHRVVCIDEIKFNREGKIEPVKMTPDKRN
jgi:beta-xylosidase